MTFTDFLIGERWLHIELNSKHRSPGCEVLEQSLASRCLADHHTTACLRAMGSADQFEAFKAVRLGSTRHVLDQFGVGGFLTFDLRELPGDVVKLHETDVFKIF